MGFPTGRPGGMVTQRPCRWRRPVLSQRRSRILRNDARAPLFAPPTRHGIRNTPLALLQRTQQQTPTIGRRLPQDRNATSIYALQPSPSSSMPMCSYPNTAHFLRRGTNSGSAQGSASATPHPRLRRARKARHSQCPLPASFNDSGWPFNTRHRGILFPLKTVPRPITYPAFWLQRLHPRSGSVPMARSRRALENLAACGSGSGSLPR
jgi:hypothetical protein